MKYRFALLLFLFFSLYNCAEHQLDGHWHVFKDDDSKQFLFSMDIASDTILVNNSDLIPPMVGELKISEGKIEIPGDCKSNFFDFELINDNEILLHNYLLKSPNKAFKFDFGNCDYINSYYSFKVKIIPITLSMEKSSKLHEEATKSNVELIAIGKYKNEIMFEYERHVANLNSIKTEFQRSVNAKGDEYRKSARIKILADKNAKISDIKEIVEYYASLRIYDGWLYCYSEAPEYKSINVNLKNIDFESGLNTLDELFK